MSYDGHLGFGLLGDFDALPELDSIAVDLKRAIASLARAAGVSPPAKPRAKKPASKAAPRKSKATGARSAAARGASAS
jgi:hypothetical protein